MRLATSLALATLLLVGAGCSEPQEKNETKDLVEKTPVEVVTSTDSASDTSIKLEVKANDSDDSEGKENEKDDDRDDDNTKTTTVQPTVQPVAKPVVTKPGAVSYTMAEVKANNTPAKCWSVVNGKVYNLSSWISKHPGGSGAIIRMCGVDATDAFTGKHGGQARPESELAGYFIGVLK